MCEIAILVYSMPQQTLHIIHSIMDEVTQFASHKGHEPPFFV
jgi:hypothetical protein